MNSSNSSNLDAIVLQYLDALEILDADVLASIWSQAETDAKLESALHEVHQALIDEGNANRWDEDAAIVRNLAETHFAERPEKSATAPLTAGDVAGRIQVDCATGLAVLTAADRTANSKLQGHTAILPEQLGQKPLTQWCENLGVAASASYWRLFRQTAIQLMMARSQTQARLAAREQNSSTMKKDDT